MFVEDLFFLIQGHFVPVRKTVFVTEGFIIILKFHWLFGLTQHWVALDWFEISYHWFHVDVVLLACIHVGVGFRTGLVEI